MALVSLVLIVGGAIVGGVIPQAPVTPNAGEIYRSYGTFWYRVITRLSLDDVFHAWWFLAVVGLFALSLVLCTARRLHRAAQRVLHGPSPFDIAEGADGVFRLDAPALTDLESRVAKMLGHRRLGRVRRLRETGGAIQLVAETRRWGIVGPDVVHVGVLVILLGALFGVVQQEGSLVVSEWEKGKRIPSCYGEGVEGMATSCVPLSFDVRVNGFGAEPYEGTGRVKDYWADLSFLRGEETVRAGRISVNHPMTVEGLSFYPWRYGPDPSSALLRLQVYDSARGAVVSELALRVGETAQVPQTDLLLTAVRYYPSLGLTETGEPVDLGSGGHPAVLLQVVGADAAGAGVEYTDLAFPFLVGSRQAVQYVLAAASVPTVMEIHYSRSPGYGIVWWGFVLVTAGTMAAFLFKPRTIRASVRGDHVLLHAEGWRSDESRNHFVDGLRKQWVEMGGLP